VKRTAIYIALILAVILAAGCPMNPSMFEEGDFAVGAPSGSFALPDDQNNDTARSRAAVFEFKTFFPVKMTVNVDLYGPSADEDGEIGLLDPSAADVFLTLRDDEGNLVYEGLIGGDGTLSADVFLPAAPEDITLTLRAAGFEPRTITIEEMVEYEKIERTIAMLQSSGVITAREAAPENDRDGDGVPDDQDVSPDDPREAYAIRIPAEGNLSVAYEDLFGHADAGDADYNDFIAAYHITEYVDAESKYLSRIEFEVTAREKIAGYDHLFGIRIDSFTGWADLNWGKKEKVGKIVKPIKKWVYKAPLEVPVFLYTSRAKGEVRTFTVTFKEPQYIGDTESPEGETVIVDRAPFNPYLYVWTTGKDVHLVGEETLRKSNNPGAVYLDGNNFPWGLLVPAEWTPPVETQRIEDFYPDFTEWRTSKGELKKDWYLNYKDPNAPPPPDVYPYPVTGPADAYFEQGIGAIQTVTLITDAPAEDNVSFHSSELPLTTSTGFEYATLDADTGVISVRGAPYTGSQYDIDVTVWIEDGTGLKSEEFVITLHFIVS